MGVILKPNLVHCFDAAAAAVQTVSEVTDKPGMITHILIAVHHSRGNDEHRGSGFSQEEILANPKGGAGAPVIPEGHLEISWTVKTEKIGLIPVRMGASPHPGVGNRDIRHGWEMFRRDLILAEDFCQPPALIRINPEGGTNDSGYLDFHFNPFGLNPSCSQIQTFGK
jgi:hypothetical protein